MTARKKARNNINDGYQDMYICMSDAHEKKKYVLQGIKDSLIMQEEFEKIAEIRKNKGLISKEIKSEMTKLNILYQKLKKELPNVKGVLSYTEKELEELEEQINSLKGTVRKDQTDLKDAEKIHNTMEELEIGLKEAKNKTIKKEEPKKIVTKPEKITKQTTPTPIKKEPSKPLSKLERIKNNLKVIEGKINQI